MHTAASLLAGAALLATAAASPLWDYVNTPDDTYKWVDTGFRYNETGEQRGQPTPATPCAGAPRHTRCACRLPRQGGLGTC